MPFKPFSQLQIISVTMKQAFIFVFFTLISCAPKAKQPANYPSGGGNTRTIPVTLVNSDTYLLTETTTDKTYGYTQGNPVKVGGVTTKEGPVNERRFLNALFGPGDKKMTYYRVGSCCPFTTDKGFSNIGMLDRYRLAEIGSKDSVDIFINMYDEGNLYVPVGLQGNGDSRK